jgi:hypothetical protein
MRQSLHTAPALQLSLLLLLAADAAAPAAIAAAAAAMVWLLPGFSWWGAVPL